MLLSVRAQRVHVCVCDVLVVILPATPHVTCTECKVMLLCVQSSQYKTVERVVQTLKNLCCALDEVETQAITEAVKRLRHSVNLPRTHSPKVGSDP